MRVLIVEDEYMIAEFIADVVRTAGHEVVGVTNSALTARTLARSKAPDLGFVDLHLRDGLAGLELARHLSEAGTLVWFITANVEHCHTHVDYALGCVPKPFQVRDIHRAVSVAEAHRDGVALPQGSDQHLILFVRKPKSSPGEEEVARAQTETNSGVSDV